ncbi:MAG: glycogen/starch synthase [Marinilabiliales bacterium]|nr:glycogen/starch synthase [Marinilabiliales bacterium]
MDNEDYFQRKFTFHDKNNKFFADNDERAIFYSRGVLETVKKLGWGPDVVHCHGWMTSLVPALHQKSLQVTTPVQRNQRSSFRYTTTISRRPWTRTSRIKIKLERNQCKRPQTL